MDYPYGHPHYQHGRNEEDSDEYRRPPYPPQPTYGGGYGGDYPPPQPSYGGDYPPPPPHVTGVYHSSHTPHMESPNYPQHHSSYSHEYGTPEYGGASVHHTSHTPHLESQNYPPPPQHHYPSFGRHESEHESGGGDGDGDGTSHHFRPHMPGFIAQHFHHSSKDDDDVVSHDYDATEGSFGGSNLEDYFANKPTFKIYSRAGDNTYSVAIRDDKVVLTYSDPSDPTQHWYKDEKYSTKVKDEDGYPSFALVNKGTGQAVKHSASAHPVQLVPFKPNVLDVSTLWTESKDLGSGFRTIRMVNNTNLVLDAFNGDADHGGIRDGLFLALFRCWKGDNFNQQWKLYPHSHE